MQFKNELNRYVSSDVYVALVVLLMCVGVMLDSGSDKFDGATLMLVRALTLTMIYSLDVVPVVNFQYLSME